MAKVFPLKSIYQFKIELDGIKPKIYRTILVEDDRTFFEFHHILQITMGWENYHLFQFIAGDYIISDPDLIEDDGVLNSKDIKLKQLFHEVGDKVKYEYDFGDGWIHKIKVEKIIPFELNMSYPNCIRGKGGCPPEDCGGPWGYENLMEVMADKKHPEYNDMKNWLGGHFDSEEFDSKIVNEHLETLDEFIEDSMYNDEE